MYQIKNTEIDDGMRLIRIIDAEGRELLYYENEVQHIPDRRLRLYLTWHMDEIMQGEFDWG